MHASQLHFPGSRSFAPGRGCSRSSQPVQCSILPPPRQTGHQRNPQAPSATPTATVATTAEIKQAVNTPCVFDVGYIAEQGLRDGMEDEVHVEWNGQYGHLFAGCYDGHGGMAAARWLRDNLAAHISSTLQHVPGALDGEATGIATHMEQAFHAADKQLLSHLEDLGGTELAEAGATATVALVWPKRVVVANVGDSQAYLWRRGHAVPLTTPHRVYGSAREIEGEVKRVESVGGWVYDGRVCNVLAVSRAFGDWEFKGPGLPTLLSEGVTRGYWPASFAKKVNFTGDPVIVTPATADTPLTADDEFLVVSTDGLWDVMPPREAMSWARRELQKGLRPQEVASSLVQIALKRHTTDNTSVVVVDLKGPQHWARGGGGHGGGSTGGGGGGGIGLPGGAKKLFGGLFGGK